MSILDNLESFLEIEEQTSLSVKLFSETVCKDCESTAMSNTDNMGREKFWEDYSSTWCSSQLFILIICLADTKASSAFSALTTIKIGSSIVDTASSVASIASAFGL